MIEGLIEFFEGSGFGQLSPGNLVMIGVGLMFITLAIKKGFEPLLLVPIGFGMLIGNIPYNVQDLSLGVYDGPVSEAKLEYFVKDQAVTIDGKTYSPWSRLYLQPTPVHRFDPDDENRPVSIMRGQSGPFLTNGEVIVPFPKDTSNEVLDKISQEEAIAKLKAAGPVAEDYETVVPRSDVMDYVVQGKVFMVHGEEFLSADRDLKQENPGIKYLKHGGHAIFYSGKENPRNPGRYPVVIELHRQDTWEASVFWFLFRGIEWGFYPPLIFLGVGALTDFGPLLANPRTILLGAAAQFGIFGALLLALLFGFDMKEAGSIGIIGGADGPTAIFTCTKLAPHLLGAVALAAYSYMAMVPIIQPPIMKLLTTKEERLIRMEAPRDVSKAARIAFPICGFILTAFIANGALPLLGMLFFGNLLRESMVTNRLAQTAQTTFIDIVTILLGLTVGAKTQASNFLTLQTIYIFVLGIVAFAVATATGLIFAKIMNAMSKKPINPLIGAAGVSAVPMAARVVQKVAHKEDPQNFLLMHAMGPNVAGVIGSAVAAGVLLSHLGG